jgi:hypothetical protein
MSACPNRRGKLPGLAGFFVTGLLTVLPPGVHAVHQAAVANDTPIAAAGSQPAAKLNLAEGASVEIIFPKAEQVFKVDRVIAAQVAAFIARLCIAPFF